LKTLFDIRSGREPASEHVLLLEAGRDYCSYVYWHRPTNTIDGMQFHSFAEVEAEKRIAAILAQCKEFNFGSVVVSSAFPQALLVPGKYFTDDYSLLDAIYDQPLQVYKNDPIPEWQMVNIYSLPTALHQLLESTFSSLQFIHAYTPVIKVYNGFVSDNQLSLYFTPQHFRVVLKKESAIHLAQTYSYQTPLDVVYYLLKICYEFGMEQSTVHLILSGLIEKDSALFTELQQYFTNVHFAHPPQMALPETELPHHFFTSLYNLALCVS
jgi:hypothetical protein